MRRLLTFIEKDGMKWHAIIIDHLVVVSSSLSFTCIIESVPIDFHNILSCYIETLIPLVDDVLNIHIKLSFSKAAFSGLDIEVNLIIGYDFSIVHLLIT